MASSIPPVLVQLVADVSQLKAGMAQAESSLKRLDGRVKTASTGMTNFMSTVKKVGATLGIAFAGAQVAKFAKDSVMAASDMAESISKVQVIFGDTSQEVLDFGKTSASAMGISTQKALEAAGTYGNLFQALGVTKDKSQEMSVSMVQLAADLGSFNNMSVDDSLNALRSGLSGETEPLKRFGVSLNDTILKAKALELGFGKIVGVMDPAIKSQVIYATVLEQTKKAQGDYARTAEGTANTMKTLSAEFDNAKVAIGNALMPAFRALLVFLKVLIPVLEAIGHYWTENADALKIYTSIILAAVGAFMVYKAVVITTTKISAIYTAVLAAQRRGFTLAQIAAFNFKLALQLINAAMRANPIGAIITLVVLLGAAFVLAWKKSETFRNVVTKAMQMVLKAFAKVAEYAGKFFNMLGKIPGMGWAKTIGNGLDGISDKLTATSNKLALLQTGALGIATRQDAAMAGRGPSIIADDVEGDKNAAAEAKKRIEKLKEYKDDVKKIYKDIREVIKEANKDAIKALAARDEKITDANKRFNETMADAQVGRDRAEVDALKKKTETLDKIEKDYKEKTEGLEKLHQAKLTSLRQSAAQKAIDLTKSATEKQQTILQQSMDRLRNAFSSKTAFTIADALGSGKSADNLLADLKTKLAAAKDLQANAAALAGMGYSQTFIEQIVSQGPAIGNEMAKALKDASPETNKEIQDLFKDVDNISNYGMDQLAATMNAGANLATKELKDAYEQVAIDLKTSLTEVNSSLITALAEENAAYQEAMTEAGIDRNEAMADAIKTYTESMADIKQRFDDTLADASKTLQETLIDAQKDYEKAIDDINQSTKEKIKDLKEDLREVVKLMAAISAASAAKAKANAPVYTPITASGSSSSSGGSTYQTGSGMTVVNNVTGINMSSPQSIVDSVMSGVKYGAAVTAPKSNFTYGSGNPLAKVT
tara:strand:- start:212 stop:3031 length:2820 start_codon:yes stop_codon:yes gene_type:complete